MKRAPAHAGGLRTSERLAFVLVFSLMATFVVGLTVLAAQSGASPLIGGTATASSTMPAVPYQLAGLGQLGSADETPLGRIGNTAGIGSTSAALSAQLATSLRAAVGSHVRRLSVGVIDMTTGATAMYRAARQYDAASIVRADILAAMLYLSQRARTPVSTTEARLAAQMIQHGSDTAAVRLWQEIGGGRGMAVANKALMLRHTKVGQAESRDLTRTTVDDQLQLLADLTAGNSPLHSAARSYALRLLADALGCQPRGVAAAASRATHCAVTNGSQPDPRLWLADSIGVIQHHGHELLMAVLSTGSPSEAEGTAVIRAAAIAAAKVIMSAGR